MPVAAKEKGADRAVNHTAESVVVIGGGNAGLCAAIAAREAGARSVLVLEAAPLELAGGNTAFTAGLMRVAFETREDILDLVPELTEGDFAKTDFGSYSTANFLADLARVTEYRCDPDLAHLLVTNSQPTLAWMRAHGVRFAPAYGRQAFEIDGRFKFWGGAVFEVVGGGPGLVKALTSEATRMGIKISYSSPAASLLNDDSGIHGVRARLEGKTTEIDTAAVVLAAGGFQANAEWRTRYLGPGWDLAKVRGTRYNTGSGIRMALQAGASPAGNWSGCHAVAWDRNAPEFGDLDVGDGFQKHSYPWGIVVNATGNRFLDEGADFRNFTYAKYGRVILEQPGQVAWQIFDNRVSHLLRDEYRIRKVTKTTASSIEGLAHKLEGVDSHQLIRTIEEYNAAVDLTSSFNPNVLDGRATKGIDPPKSNWANPIDTPPFEAYGVTCGITFTFGGLRVDSDAQVIGVDGTPIRGLFACGELAAGIFYFNYPGGSGLTNGAVFGRIAGQRAAAMVCI
jgi:tricarballylate dehydrogenase